jgi:3D (Asp-Asp-Asp) domain-containing protein
VKLFLFLLFGIAPMEVTAYTVEDCGRWCDGYTSTMTRPEEGRTAACHPVLTKMRAKIYVVGVTNPEGVSEAPGWRICEDVGGRIGPWDVDLFVTERRRALAWGRRTVLMVVQRL